MIIFACTCTFHNAPVGWYPAKPENPTGFQWGPGGIFSLGDEGSE